MSLFQPRSSRFQRFDRETAEILSDPHPRAPLQVLIRLVCSQRNYIFWHVTFLALHFAELLVLALIHRIYFPPESLLLLRVCSTVSLIAVIASCSARLSQSFSDSDAERGGGPDAWRVARLLFQSTLLLMLALAVCVYLSRDANFASPPIFRALVFSIFITLPFDCMLNFIFLNQRAFSRLIHRRHLRTITLLGDLVSLWCVYTDQPVLCLLSRTLPRLWAALAVWKDVTGFTVSRLFEARLFADASERKSAVYLIQTSGPAVACAGLMEVSLYWSLWLLNRGVEGAALLIFCSHKIVHLGHLVSLRLGMRQSAMFDAADVRVGTQMGLAFLRRWGLVMLASILVAILFSPMLLLQKEVVLWSSHLGESFGWSLAVGLSVLALTGARICTHGLVTMAALRLRRWRECLPVIIWMLFVGSVLSWLTRSVLVHEEMEQTLISLSSAEALLNLGFLWCVAWLLMRELRLSHAALKRGASIRFLEEFERDLTKPSDSVCLVYVKTSGKLQKPLLEVVTPAEKDGLKPFACFSIIGNQSLMLLRASRPLGKVRIRQSLARCLAGGIEELRILKSEVADYHELFPFGVSSESVTRWLVDLLRQGKPEPTLSEEERERLDFICETAFGTSRATEAAMVPGFVVASAAEKWDLSHISERDLRKQIVRYGKRLIERDLVWNPIPLWKGEFRGFVHLVRNGEVVRILWFDASLRSLKPHIENAALVRSFVELFSAFGAAERMQQNPPELSEELR